MLPSKEQLNKYCGVGLTQRIKGYSKNQDDNITTFLELCDSVVIENLPGLKRTNLTENEEEDYKRLILEQARYFLSLGDYSVLSEKQDYYFSGRVAIMAKQAGLWSFTTQTQPIPKRSYL